MNAIQVTGLEKTFTSGFFKKKVPVLKGVDFTVPASMTCGFVGNNGSGKTTTIKCLLQFIKPQKGQIHFFGQTLDNSIKRKIGYLPERPYLYEFLTAMELLEFHWRLTFPTQNGFIEKAHATLKRVNLFDVRDRRLRTFSKGMLQRAGLAQALLHEPDLLILDEPMSGLDPDGRMLVKDILREQQKQKRGIFFSSHLLEDMEQLCSHIVIIHEGLIFYQGEIARVMTGSKTLEDAFKVIKAKGWQK